MLTELSFSRSPRSVLIATASPTSINAGENLLIKAPLFTMDAGLLFRGAYNSAIAYVVNNAIIGSDLIAYKVTANTTGNAPPNGSFYSALTALATTSTNYILVELIQSGRAPVTWLYQYVGSPLTQIATQTSGLLVADAKYKIITFVAGDDFTNVGAASNTTGVVFVATGTTPTVWSNSSVLQRVILTPGNQYIISSFGASDVFTNIGAGSNATGVIFTATGDAVPTTWTHSSILQQVSFPTNMLLASGLLTAELLKGDTVGKSGVFDLRISISTTDATYIGSGVQTDVMFAPGAIQIT